MRQEMLSDLKDGEDTDSLKFGLPTSEEDGPPRDDQRLKEPEKDYSGVDWESMVSGTKRVLRMEVSGCPVHPNPIFALSPSGASSCLTFSDLSITHLPDRLSIT